MAGYVGKYKGSFKRGAKGKDCAAVKRTLKRIQKNERIKHTQNFGGEAEKALKVFQKNHDLRPDGIYGPVTHRKLAPMMRGYEIWLYKRAPVRQSAIATWVVMGPNADRKGVATKGVVKDFVSKVAHEFGAPVIITTGTNHNQYVAGTRASVAALDRRRSGRGNVWKQPDKTWAGRIASGRHARCTGVLLPGWRVQRGR